MTDKTCYQCGGIIAFGQEAHEMRINGEPTFWCIECIEIYADAVWNDEDWGPRKGMNIAKVSARVN